LAKRSRDLEGAPDPGAADPARDAAGDLLAAQPDGAGGGRERAGDQVEGGALAGPVRPDQAEDLALPQVERYPLHRREPTEPLGEATHREQRAIHSGARRCPAVRARKRDPSAAAAPDPWS